MKVKAKNKAPQGGGKREAVETYSSASRRRFMELFASLDAEVLLDAWVGRLSWSDDNLPDGEEAKRCLDTLRRDISRQYPNMCIMWRMEIESRKSGEFTGVPVPHFHYVVVSNDMTNIEDFEAWIAEVWHRITGCRDKNHAIPGIGTHLQPVHGDPSRVAFYVSKYTSKVSSEAVANFGWPGRFWGVLGRKNWPKARETKGMVSADVLKHLRRLCRAWLKSKSGKSGKRYADFVAKNNRVGFSLIGLPSSEFNRMLHHAIKLSESTG